MKKYAYIRVSSKDQNIARQVEAMKSIGISEKDMFIDKQSGKDFFSWTVSITIKKTRIRRWVIY